MAAVELDALFVHYPEIIGHLRNEFTSHEFILALAQAHQREYVEALYRYRDSRSPFMIVHGQIAQQLLQLNDLVEKRGEVNSRDIFGDSAECAAWAKR